MATGSDGYDVGVAVVYASYGLGRVDSTRPANGTVESLTLSFAGGLTVTLPIARALETLRPPSDAAALERVALTLRAPTSPSDESWSRRQRAARQKVQSGDVTELAEVVRDGIRRELLRSTRSGAPSDRQLYMRARQLLAGEIAFCRGVDDADADAWVVEQSTAVTDAP